MFCKYSALIHTVYSNFSTVKLYNYIFFRKTKTPNTHPTPISNVIKVYNNNNAWFYENKLFHSIFKLDSETRFKLHLKGL